MSILHNCIKNGKNSVTALDKVIKKYVETNPTDDYSSILKKDSRFDVFYHLSDLRAGLFSWYDFKSDSTLLEIGAGYGALIGYFCTKCVKVVAAEPSLFRAQIIQKRYAAINNLEIYTGKPEQLNLKEKFDYVVLVQDMDSCREITSEYIKNIKALLKPDGILLLSAENRLGLKRFCGEKFTSSVLPFAEMGLSAAQGKVFSKREITDILKDAGFKNLKFYYPLPDYKFPQLIYTDKYLPQKNFKERLIPYYKSPETLILNASELYDDIIDNNVFPFFADSYLIECGVQDNFSKAIYAALSTDRGRGKAFATVIYDNDKVKKEAMYKEGQEHVQALYNNHADLVQYGIPIVKNELKGNALWMDYIKAPLLMDYLREHMAESKEIIKIFDDLYKVIIASSKHAAPEKNKLLNMAPEADWGVILKKAYIELIPLNCFYAKKKFLFFDQEYIRENYPAKYVLFRALYYVFIFIPEIAKTLSLEFFQRRYNISEEVWDILHYEEDKCFQPEVRQHKIYKAFFDKHSFDYHTARENMFLLSRGGEVRRHYLFDKYAYKKLIIFGTGAYFKDFISRYGIKYKPIFLVDNNPAKWGKFAENIVIKSPDELRKMVLDEFYIIICTKYYREIEQQLKNMGIKDYCIYI